MYASYTHFRCKWWAIPLFQYHAIRAYGQANRSIGLQSIQAWTKGIRNYCTLTVWDSKQDMLHYIGKGAHLRAMQRSDLLGQGYTTGWQTGLRPTRTQAEAQLKNKLVKLGQLKWL